ncbi:MAG: ATP-binding cassette domain-containing protein [Lachnospiraceae bacterium]|nr:ATP-binding cassette domain-containing protein [Lachnospiraceae bacterium]
MNIKVKNLTKTIKGNNVLSDVNVEFHSGKIYGLQGKNGSGKTMLLKAISGLIFPTDGVIEIDGKTLGVDMEFPEDMGILIENPSFVGNMSAQKNLMDLVSIRNKVGIKDVNRILEVIGLEAKSKKKFRNFSLGMKQKLGIAAALVEKPALILLDEPTNALDEKSVMKLREILNRRREEGALIIIASHDKDEMALLCDEIYLVDDGRVRG